MALATSVVSHWKLDESSGNITDSAGSNTGTNTGTTTFTTGKLNNGASFNGSSQYFDMGTPASLNITGNITMSAWIKTTQGSGTEGAIISNYNSGGSKCQYQMKVYNSAGTITIRYNINNTSQQELQSVGSITSNVWTHVVGTYDGSTIRLYINGKLDTSVSATQTPPSSGYGNTAIGRAGSYNGLYYNGMIDEATIWSRALSLDEILQIYNNGKTNAYPHTDTPALYGSTTYYKMENTTDEGGLYTLSATGSPGSGTGKVGNARTYVGGTSRDGFAKTDGASQGTFSFWFNYSSINASFGRIISKTQSGVTDVMLLAIDTSNRLNVHLNDSANLNTSFSTLSTGTWYHYVVTWDGSNVKTYKNGVLETNAVSTKVLQANGQNFYIGGTDVNTQGITGSVDEIAFFPRAISATEVTSIYGAGSANQYPFTTNVDISVSATVQAITFTIPSYTATAIRNVTVSQGTPPNITFSIPTYTPKTDVSVTPSAQSITFSIPTYQAFANDALISPSAQTITFSVPSYTITTVRHVTVSATTPAITFSIPTYTATAIQNTTVTPAVQAITFTIPSYSVTAIQNATISPSAQVVTFSIPSYTVTAIRTIEVAVSVQTITFTIPSYTVTAVAHVTISANVFSFTFTIPSYIARGDFWQDKHSASATSWSNKHSAPATSWNNKY